MTAEGAALTGVAASSGLLGQGCCVCIVVCCPLRSRECCPEPADNAAFARQQRTWNARRPGAKRGHALHAVATHDCLACTPAAASAFWCHERAALSQPGCARGSKHAPAQPLHGKHFSWRTATQASSQAGGKGSKISLSGQSAGCWRALTCPRCEGGVVRRLVQEAVGVQLAHALCPSAGLPSCRAACTHSCSCASGEVGDYAHNSRA